MLGVRTVVGWVPGDAPAAKQPVAVDVRPPPALVIAAAETRPMTPDLELPGDGWARPFEVVEASRGVETAMLSLLKLDRAASTADTFVVREPLPALEGGAPGRPSLEVHDTQVTPSTVTLDVTVDRASYLRVAQSYYPYQRVEIDGARTKAVPDVSYATVVRVTAGRHRIRFEGGLSPLRRGLGALSLLLLALATAAELRARRLPATVRR